MGGMSGFVLHVMISTFFSPTTITPPRGPAVPHSQEESFRTLMG